MWKKTTTMRISRHPSPVQIMIDQNELDSVEYFRYLGSMITRGARRTRIATANAALGKKYNPFTSKFNLNLRMKLVKCYTWRTALSGAETWALRNVDQNYLESSEMWYWRRMETISWTDRVRNKEVLHRVNEERNILHTIKRRNANWSHFA